MMLCSLMFIHGVGATVLVRSSFGRTWCLGLLPFGRSRNFKQFVLTHLSSHIYSCGVLVATSCNTMCCLSTITSFRYSKHALRQRLCDAQTSLQTPFAFGMAVLKASWLGTWNHKCWWVSWRLHSQGVCTSWSSYIDVYPEESSLILHFHLLCTCAALQYRFSGLL